MSEIRIVRKTSQSVSWINNEKTGKTRGSSLNYCEYDINIVKIRETTEGQRRTTGSSSSTYIQAPTIKNS